MDAVKTAPLLLTIPETCARLRIGRSRLLKEIHSGRLPSIRFGRAIRISEQTLAKWIEAQSAPAR